MDPRVVIDAAAASATGDSPDVAADTADAAPDGGSEESSRVVNPGAGTGAPLVSIPAYYWVKLVIRVCTEGSGSHTIKGPSDLARSSHKVWHPAPQSMSGWFELGANSVYGLAALHLACILVLFHCMACMDLPKQFFCERRCQRSFWALRSCPSQRASCYMHDDPKHPDGSACSPTSGGNSFERQTGQLQLLYWVRGCKSIGYVGANLPYNSHDPRGLTICE